MEELHYLKDKLKKAEEDKKTLISSIAKLQIIVSLRSQLWPVNTMQSSPSLSQTRQQTSALNPSSHNFLQVRSGRSSGPGSVVSSNRSIRSENAQLLRPLDSTLHSKGSQSRLAEDITMVIHDEPQPPRTVTEAFPGMLEVRFSLLAGSPSVTLPDQYDATNNHFSRDFLKDVLSGDNKAFLDRYVIADCGSDIADIITHKVRFANEVFPEEGGCALLFMSYIKSSSVVSFNPWTARFYLCRPGEGEKFL